MDNKNEFLDEERMYISFSSLILNVASINKQFGGLKEFMTEFDLAGQTNGKLLIVSQMVEPPFELIEIVETKLHPLGFLKDEDYIFANEQLIRGVGNFRTPYLNKTHPDCDGISWLGSIVSWAGNFVWFKTEVDKPKPLYQISP